MKTQLTLTQALDGFELHIQARRLSPHTRLDYFNTFRKFTAYLGADPPIARISAKDIEAFLAGQEGISKKTLLNYHTGLSALWTWAVDEDLVKEHIVRRVSPPRPEKREVQPYSEADIRLMLNTMGRSRPYSRPGKRSCTHSLQHTDRNRAIILLLLDTGIRASELCDARIQHCDMRNRHLIVFGKGSKERILPFCARTGQAIWKYLATRKDEEINAALFVTEFGNPFNRDTLLDLLEKIGERAGLAGVNIHRFRHTFAINYLRNGGDPYSLQRLLGHSTLEMVKRYLSLVQADVDRNHKLASPVDNWHL